MCEPVAALGRPDRSPPESGRSPVNGCMLKLTGDEGKIERLSLLMPDKGSDKLLVINGSNYLKQDSPTTILPSAA